MLLHYKTCRNVKADVTAYKHMNITYTKRDTLSHLEICVKYNLTAMWQDILAPKLSTENGL